VRTHLVLSFAVHLTGACARGTHEPPALVDAAADMQVLVDAPAEMIDAPMHTSTCAMPFTGSLAKWDFTGQPGNQTSTPATMNAPGVTAGAISRATGLMPIMGSNSINSASWSTAATMDATKYYTFTLSPPAGCMAELTKVTINSSASGTGPTMVALGTSVDAYAATKPVTVGAAFDVAVTASTSDPIELRIYGWAATGTGGTLRVQGTLSVDGELR
jgi:hypothetical protein